MRVFRMHSMLQSVLCKPGCGAVAATGARGGVTSCGGGCCRRSSSDLYKGLDACAVGDTIELEVLRQDSRERVPIILEPSS